MKGELIVTYYFPAEVTPFDAATWVACRWFSIDRVLADYPVTVWSDSNKQEVRKKGNDE